MAQQEGSREGGGEDLIRRRGPLFASPDNAQQPRLLVGLHTDEFDAEICVSRPSSDGQFDRQRFLRLVKSDLDLKIL